MSASLPEGEEQALDAHGSGNLDRLVVEARHVGDVAAFLVYAAEDLKSSGER